MTIKEQKQYIEAFLVSCGGLSGDKLSGRDIGSGEKEGESQLRSEPHGECEGGSAIIGDLRGSIYTFRLPSIKDDQDRY